MPSAAFLCARRSAPAPKPRLIAFNDALASELGFNAQGREPDELAAVFAGNVAPPGAEPIAMAYAGHQFGSFVPQLGDGRAILLGEVLDRNGRRRDIQLKGAGKTPFSRGGDGRAALGPVLREYLVSEAMHALGIPTTRALAAVTTGQPVYRDRPLPGAVLTRIASSHIRVGTFEYFAARGDREAVERLADYVIDRHFPQARDAERPGLALLQAVAERQAQLIARWMHVGFIHGVMNTDNTALSGETIDFGPCAFMDGYDPATSFSAIDEFGRYAYVNQPAIAQWNLARFAETLLLLLDPDPDRAVELANEAISTFAERYQEHWLAGMRKKLGISGDEDGDLDLVRDLLQAMHGNAADFTLTFRRLCAAAEDEAADIEARGLFADPACLRPLGREVAIAFGRRQAGAARTRQSDARRQSSFHPAQSSRGASPRSGARPGRLFAVRRTADGSLAALRGSSRFCRIRRAASNRPARLPHILRDLMGL